MCGISGAFNINRSEIPHLDKRLQVMCDLIKHRGPDGEGYWSTRKKDLGFGHRRLAIIDIETGKQPMVADSGNSICFNGEIYNYKELKIELQSNYNFKTDSDTEVILAAYEKWGEDCLNRFRGMFAFALWDERNQKLFCARDQFGIKPFYYTIIDNTFYFCSEAKGLLPFLDKIETDLEALKNYLVFQLYLNEKTLFKNVTQLMPAHKLVIQNQNVQKSRYWEVHYDINYSGSRNSFQEQLRHSIEESINLHVRADVPIGAYVSGGFDSSAIAALAKKENGSDLVAFTGKFSQQGQLFDESKYAEDLCQMHGIKLYQKDMGSQDFRQNIEKIIYHLDFPVAGPGAFPQFCVSELASKHRKVTLGGQGGDEIFGGYTRYLIAYFEQCIKGAIEGTLNNGNFIVTYESIIKNLTALNTYKPLMKDFFKEGMFDSIDKRYYRLINRSPDLGDEINWEELPENDPFETFAEIFNGKNVGKESYFDKMTHFDFKTLLPGLLQVEDRMSMAWGLESRVPLIETKLVEFAATMPANIKFQDGNLKMVLVDTIKDLLPKSIIERKNKMGFPVPLNQWINGELSGFIKEIFSQKNSQSRLYIDNRNVINTLQKSGQFGRQFWGMLSLEIWHQQFHDKEYEFKNLAKFN